MGLLVAANNAICIVSFLYSKKTIVCVLLLYIQYIDTINFILALSMLGWCGHSQRLARVPLPMSTAAKEMTGENWHSRYVPTL